LKIVDKTCNKQVTLMPTWSFIHLMVISIPVSFSSLHLLLPTTLFWK